jgi:pseudouridine kinase
MVNTTGCGDSAMAAIVWSYLEEADLEDTALAAVAAGAITMESVQTIHPGMCAEALKARMK